MSYTFPEEQLGVSLSLGETAPSLPLALPGPCHRGRGGRCIRLNRPCLRSPRHFGEGQGAPDRSTLTGWARHPPRRREAFEVGPQKMVLSARPGRYAGSVASDHLVVARLWVRRDAFWGQERSGG